jgi:hypothetical protein
MRSGIARRPQPPGAIRILLALSTALIATQLSQFVPEVVHADALTPTVTAVSPEAGPTTGGTTVTITGTNFQAIGMVVNFGPVQDLKVTDISATALQVVTPSGVAAGQVTVTVSTLGALTSLPNPPITTFQFTSPGPTHAITDVRVCDTRAGQGTLCSGAGNAVAPGGSRNIQVTGVAGVPGEPGVTGVLADLVVAPAPGSSGSVAIFPTGLAGGANSLSWTNGYVETVLTEIPVNPQGQVTVINSPSPYSTGSVDILLDVEGYVSDSQTDASGLTNPIDPIQPPVCDTGTSPGNSCYIAGNLGWRAGSTHNVTVLGVGGVPPSGVSAVVLNVQAYAENVAGDLRIYPTGQSQPLAAALAYQANTPSTNHVVVPVGANGQVAVYDDEATGYGAQVQIGLDGWITDASQPSPVTGGPPPGGLYNPNNGTLVCDTIAGTNTPCSTGGQLTGGTPLSVQITGQGGVPSSASTITGVELSITVTNVNLPPGVGTYVCVYPSSGTCQEGDLNLYGGAPANLLVILPVGVDGKINISTPVGDMDVLVAVTGYYTPGISSTHTG